MYAHHLSGDFLLLDSNAVFAVLRVYEVPHKEHQNDGDTQCRPKGGELRKTGDTQSAVCDGIIHIVQDQTHHSAKAHHTNSKIVTTQFIAESGIANHHTDQHGGNATDQQGQQIGNPAVTVQKNGGIGTYTHETRMTQRKHTCISGKQGQTDNGDHVCAHCNDYRLKIHDRPSFTAYPGRPCPTVHWA